MQDQQYSISFTTCSIRPIESLKIANAFHKTRDWVETRRITLDENLLQQRTFNSSKRLYREISSRLKYLTQEEIELLLAGNTSNRNQMLWQSVCRRYDFIRDFSLEVLHNHFARLDYTLLYEHFDAFWSSKAVFDPHLQNVARSTRLKARQVLFKMMREISLLDTDNQLVFWSYSEELIRTVTKKHPETLVFFPNYILLHGENT